ncbi:MAG: protein kinase [Candidatus Kerfeldbacteria bacterium]|nr:protein kinase [Candidatus Kerfeldbacteria bacterium]
MSYEGKAPEVKRQPLRVEDQQTGGEELLSPEEQVVLALGTETTPVNEKLRTDRRQLFEAMKLVFSDDDTTVEQGLELLMRTEITIKNTTYRVTDVIGRGAFGFVVEVEPIKTPGVKAALKLSQPFDRKAQYLQPGSDPEDLVDYPERARAEHTRGYIREVAALKKIDALHHPSAYPSYYDAQFIPNPDQPDRHKPGEPDERIGALLMERIDGDNLHDLLTDGLRDAPDVLLDLAEQFAKAIALTHQAGFVHRDIKPANAMVDSSGLRMLDLGLVAMLEPKSGKTATYQTAVESVDVGTTDYMLETEADPLSPQRDVYQLGRTFQQLFVGKDYNQALAINAAVVRAGDPLMQEFGQLFYKMIKTDPQDRPTIQQVVVELDRLQSELKQRTIRTQIAAS